MHEIVARDRTIPASSRGSPSTRPGASARPRRTRPTGHAAVGRRWSTAIRQLDPTRLVEDNSPCHYDHVANTDLNSWHFYIDDHAKAREHIDEVVAKTEPGSAFNYCPGRCRGPPR